MDNSQSSEIFSETSVHFRDISTIDIESYEALVSKIKKDVKYQIDEKSFNNFPSFLDECSNCVFQGFHIITYLLEDSASSVAKLCLYLEETVFILQIVSNLIKTIIESIAMTCCAMRTFSTTTGNIILSVFSHCKESECIYGNHIRMFEKQLKDLFRNCHELQLTYLMTLEKHFIFDMTEKDEHDIFIETLNINLKIGELVQALDVKTMAEQWKAYTMICEKYSNFLSDGDIYTKSTKVLVDIVRNNIKTAVEANEDKVVIRSLKVASFSLKILLRICKIFNGTSRNNYEDIVDVLQEILLYNSNYYALYDKIRSEVLNVIQIHLIAPSQAIITSLVTEEHFIKYVNSIQFKNTEDLKMLKYILLVTEIMNAAPTQTNTSETSLNMIKNIISILPQCHKYLNMGLEFSYKNNEKMHGLFEYLLINSLKGSYCFNSQCYVHLEKMLIEVILATDCVSAVFCSNLWVLLCRSGSGQLQLNTLLGLIQLYHKFQGNTVFPFSPQSTNLACTIENLFKILHYNEKLQIYKRYSIYDEKSYDLWAVLKIRNLPENLQMSARKVVIQKIVNMTEIHSEHLQTEQINDMIRIMKLASTCEFLECDSRVENVLVRSWCKVCPKTNNIKLEKYLDVGSLLYFRFLTALVSLTESYHERFSDKSHTLKIVRVITDLLMLGNIETITALCRLFCKLVAGQGRSQYDIILHTFKYLFESDVKQYVYSVITSNGDFDNFFTQMFHKEKALQEACSDIKQIKSIHRNNYEWQQKLRSVSEYRYTHKCIQSTDVAKFTTKTSECDFGSEDFEMSSDNENDHRVNKKAKMDPNIGNILERLESDVSQLSQVKENILNEQHKTRIRNVWEKLGNLT